MDFFGDEGRDPFDKIVREFFGEEPAAGRKGIRKSPGQKRVSSGESELSEDYVQTPKNVFLVLDLSNKTVVDVNVQSTPREESLGEEGFQNKKVLEIVFSDNDRINYPIPKEAKENKYDWHFNNGILEVQFKK